MPKLKSAKKRLRQSRARHLRNQAIRSQVKTGIRSARAAIAADAPEAEAAVRQVCRLADKAVSKGVLHPNTAARKKSRLARRVRQATA